MILLLNCGRFCWTIYRDDRIKDYGIGIKGEDEKVRQSQIPF